MVFYGGHKKFTLESGATLAYCVLRSEHLGKKRPLVLINGMSGRMGDWENLTRELEKKRPILIFDHRGIGDSTAKDEDEVSIESYARDTIALIKYLGWGEVDICGHSMGGMTLQQILITPSLPFHLAHALLTATTTKAPHGDEEVMALMGNRAPTGRRLTPGEKNELVRSTMGVNFDKAWMEDGRNESVLGWWTERGLIGRPNKVIMKQGLAIRATDLRPSLPSILETNPQTRILVIHGTLDRLIHPSEAEYLYKLIPHAVRLEVGTKRGQVPSLQFGHMWWEYFGVGVWEGVVEGFLEDEMGFAGAKL